ncbi:hypothetical protein E2C01_048698 [Portunus trituberculatus]|uniref:Uncharacterized protein n=1 Tax=Portunus trituberculatus TaxID=210409 RepID=A0A5B7GBT9_PORTR|nr:hypothetical protein [Portunus trituberculatus]
MSLHMCFRSVLKYSVIVYVHRKEDVRKQCRSRKEVVFCSGYRAAVGGVGGKEWRPGRHLIPVERPSSAPCCAEVACDSSPVSDLGWKLWNMHMAKIYGRPQTLGRTLPTVPLTGRGAGTDPVAVLFIPTVGRGDVVLVGQRR